MADTVFEVQSSGLGPEGPQCMSSPLQSPMDDGPDKTGHMTMKSDDSGIMMDESTFSMNDTMNSGDDVSSPEVEEKIITNGHACDQEEVQANNVKNAEDDANAISSLVAAMEEEDGKASPVPQITIDSPSQEEEVEESILEESKVEESKVEEVEGAQVADDEETTKEEEAKKEEEEAKKEEEEEEEEEESEEEELEEDDSVQFVKDVDKDTLKELGIRCTDAWTALEILNTRYRLTPATPAPGKPLKTYHTLPRAKVSKKKQLEEQKKQDAVPAKRCIITWSCWNIADMVHPVGSDRASWWAKLPEPTQEDKDENENIKDLNTSIGTKADEIDALVAKVLEDERKKKEQEDRLKEEEEKAKAPKPVEETVDKVEEAPIEAEPPASKQEEEPKKKKKKGNLWQRMVRSVRKRFGGNRTAA